MAVYSVNNSNGRFTLKLTLTEETVDIVNNTSLVSYKLELKANTAWDFLNYDITKKIVLGSKTVHNLTKVYSSGEYNTITLAEGSETFKHNNDGALSLSVSYSISMTKEEWTPGNLSGSGTFKLTDIARKATVTSSESFTDEGSPTIYFSNPGKFDVQPYFNVYDSSNDLVYSFKENRGQYTSPHTFEIPDDKREELRKKTNLDTSYKVNIGVYTYNGSEYLGYHSKSYTFTIINADPVFTQDDVSYIDTNTATYALTESEGQTIVSMASLVKVTCKAAKAQKGATISRYDISLGVAYGTISNSEGGDINIGAVTSNEDVVLSVRVVDSRGNYTTVRKTVSVLPYTAPKLFSSDYGYILCERCDETGTIDKSGKCLMVSAQGRWSALPNGKNTAKLQVKIETAKEVSGWCDLSATVTPGDANNLYVSTCDFNGKADGVELEAANSYTVTVRCIDALNKYVEMSFRIPTQAVDLHLRKGAAFGEYVTEENTLKLSNDWTANSLYGLGKCKQLTEGEDLNNCLEFRVYGISTDVCKTINNLPLGHYGLYDDNGDKVLQAVGGILKVYSADGLGIAGDGEDINILQEYTVISGMYKYLRRVTKNTGTGKCTFSRWFLVQQRIETADNSDL